MAPQQNSSKVLILGSAPNVVAVNDIDLSCYDEIIVINNAWQVLGSWTEHIFPYDFPQENKPMRYANGQRPIDEKLFVRRQNEFGGFIYAGGTMAFTALYWALLKFGTLLAKRDIGQLLRVTTVVQSVRC